MKNKILTVIFIVLLAASAVMIWLPADEASVARENRAMAKMPETDAESLFSGRFSSGFESYIGDNVGFRGMFTGISEKVSALKGYTSDLGKVISVNKDVGTETTQKSRLLVTDDTVMEVFENKREHMEWYLNVLEHYSEKLDKDINFFSMLIPTQLEFKEPLYSNIQDKQKDTIDYIYENKPDRVIPVNVYLNLSDHRDEYIYYRTDHHWTARGAYYGYSAFMEVMRDTLADDKTAEKEFAPVKMEDFTRHEEKNFLGYLYMQAQSPELSRHPDTIEWYDLNEKGNITIHDEYYKDGESVQYDSVIFAKADNGEYRNEYSLFLGGDQPLIEMTNKSIPDGRTIIVIKDSYCNCFAPWLIQNFHKVIMIDPRTYEGSLNEVIDRYKPDDLMLMNYIFTTTFADYCQMTIDFFNR